MFIKIKKNKVGIKSPKKIKVAMTSWLMLVSTKEY